MNSLHLGRCAFCNCVAVAMLAGCGGSQPPIAAPGAVTQGNTVAAHWTDPAKTRH